MRDIHLGGVNHVCALGCDGDCVERSVTASLSPPPSLPPLSPVMRLRNAPPQTPRLLPSPPPPLIASPDEEDDVPEALDGALRVAAAVLGGGATTEPASRVAAGVVYCTGEGAVHTL